jgi:hydroxyacylglutathione hydrolase
MRDTILKCLQVGYLPTNCYILACSKSMEGMIIDPGILANEEERIIHAIRKSGVTIKYIVNTHGHPDHTSGNRAVKEHTQVQILVHEYDAPLLAEPWLGTGGFGALKKPHRCPVCGREEMLRLDVKENRARMIAECGAVLIDAEISPPADRVLHDKDRINIGCVDLEVLHTPGHTKGGISLYCAEEEMIFTGDTLFEGSWGRIDLPGSSEEEMTGSLHRLGKLPLRTVVYPGHGAHTTIGKEKKTNPYM